MKTSPKNPLELLANLIQTINVEQSNPVFRNLFKNMLEILKTITLLDWAVETATDAADDYNYKDWEEFCDTFPFWDEVNEVQEEYNNLTLRNQYYYFILLMISCEKFLNESIKLFSQKCPLHFKEKKKNYKYLVNSERNLKIIKIKNGHDTYTQYLTRATINEKLMFFHDLFGTNRPKLPKFKRNLTEIDFEFYSLLRNIILHENGEIKDPIELAIYSQVQPSIVVNHTICLNSTFFYIAVINLIKICVDISNKMMNKLV